MSASGKDRTYGSGHGSRCRLSSVLTIPGDTALMANPADEASAARPPYVR
jgi:hypothetical protein